jgi:hypothetical protein
MKSYKTADKYRSTIYRFIRFRSSTPFKSHGTSVTQAHHGWQAQNIKRFHFLSSGLSMVTQMPSTISYPDLMLLSELIQSCEMQKSCILSLALLELLAFLF